MGVIARCDFFLVRFKRAGHKSSVPPNLKPSKMVNNALAFLDPLGLCIFRYALTSIADGERNRLTATGRPTSSIAKEWHYAVI